MSGPDMNALTETLASELGCDPSEVKGRMAELLAPPPLPQRPPSTFLADAAKRIAEAAGISTADALAGMAALSEALSKPPPRVAIWPSTLRRCYVLAALARRVAE